MSTGLRVRLADWRDRDAVQRLRRHAMYGPDGGLFELLNWPMYHVHTAVVEGQTVGYTSVALLPDGAADGVGTAVEPEYRRQGVATMLRATQIRDLALMGWTWLFETVPQTHTEGVQMCRRDFGETLGLIPAPENRYLLYFGAPLDALLARLRGALQTEPYALSDTQYGRLMAKTEHVRRELVRMAAVGQVEFEKHTLRAAVRGSNGG